MILTNSVLGINISHLDLWCLVTLGSQLSGRQTLWFQSTQLMAPTRCKLLIIFTYLLTYLLTTWSRVFLKKQKGFQLVKTFPSFHGTRRFITSFTSARHPSLSWASSNQSIPPHPTSWRSILILSSHLRLGLPSGSFPQVSAPKPCIWLFSLPYTLHAQPIPLFSILSPEQYWVRITVH